MSVEYGLNIMLLFGDCELLELFVVGCLCVKKCWLLVIFLLFSILVVVLILFGMMMVVVFDLFDFENCKEY